MKRIWMVFGLLSFLYLSFSLSPVDAGASSMSPGMYYHVLVVYNANYTEDDNNNTIPDGEEIKDYYMEKRHIPSDHFCELNTSTSEVIPRELYDQQYDTSDVYPNHTHIKQSLEECLVNKSLKEDISFIVLTKGVPLKISTYQQSGYLYADYSSLDHSICLLFNNATLTWRHSNPYCWLDYDMNLDERFRSFKYNFTDYMTSETWNLSYLVSRLDAYNITEVFGMIDRAFHSDTSLTGQWVLDDDPDCTGSGCDYMYSANNTLCLDLNLSDYVSYEDTNSALTGPEDVNNNSVIGYSSHGKYGTGLGNNAIENGILTFSLSNGSIYTSWESFNGYSYDDPDATVHNTVADWIRFGGTAGVGSVYEPWCSGITHEDLFFSRYAAGYSFIEAAYMSQQYNDFITTVAGDPMLRIVPDDSPPDISSVYPMNGTRMNPGSLIDLHVFEDYPDTLFLDYNGSNMSFEYPFDVNTSGWSYGDYEIKVFGNDTEGNSLTKTFVFEINSTVGEYPEFSNFDGETTEFHKLADRTNVTGAVLERSGYGKIVFLENVNVSGLDIDSYVNISENLANLDSQNLPNLNRSANVTLYGLAYDNPIPYVDGEPCHPDFCTGSEYSGGNLRFSVPHFTSYSAGPNSNMTIWDSGDNGMPFGGVYVRMGMMVGFFANFTNITSGEPVLNATCKIGFSWGVYDMGYNSSGFYQYNRTFSRLGIMGYSINCTSEEFENLTASDDITIYTVQLEQPPVITNPNHTSNSSHWETVFRWNSSGSLFDLQVDDDTDFLSPAVNASGITSEYYSLPENGLTLEQDRYYYVRVRSNESGWGYLTKGVNDSSSVVTDVSLYGQYYPDIAVDGQGISHVIWYGRSDQISDKYNIRYANSTNLSSITEITSESTYNQYWPSVAVGPDGVVHAAWQGQIPGNPGASNIWYSNSTDWSNYVYITNQNDYDQRVTDIAVDSKGIAHVAWFGPTDAYPSKDNIRYSNSTEWGTIRSITSSNTYDHQNPSLAVGENDTVHLVWNGKTPSQPSFHIRYANSTDWTNTMNYSGCVTGIQAQPSIATGDDGLIHVVFTGPTPGSGGYSNIQYFNTINNSKIYYLTDEDSYEQMRPSIAVDSAGYAHVSWHGKTAEYPSRNNIFYANSSNFSGTLMVTRSSTSEQQYSSLACFGGSVRLSWNGNEDVMYSDNIGKFLSVYTEVPGGDEYEPPGIGSSPSGISPVTGCSSEFVLLTDEKVSIGQGDSHHLQVTVENTGTCNLTNISLRLYVPEGWMSENRMLPVLDAGKEAVLEMLLEPPGSSSGNFSVTLVAGTGGISKSREIMVEIREKSSNESIDRYLTESMIREVREKVKEMLENGMDPCQVQALLRRALESLEEKDYQQAGSLAQQAMSTADKLMSQNQTYGEERDTRVQLMIKLITILFTIAIIISILIVATAIKKEKRRWLLFSLR